MTEGSCLLSIARPKGERKKATNFVFNYGEKTLQSKNKEVWVQHSGKKVPPGGKEYRGGCICQAKKSKWGGRTFCGENLEEIAAIPGCFNPFIRGRSTQKKEGEGTNCKPAQQEVSFRCRDVWEGWEATKMRNSQIILDCYPQEGKIERQKRKRVGGAPWLVLFSLMLGQSSN